MVISKTGKDLDLDQLTEEANIYVQNVKEPSEKKEQEEKLEKFKKIIQTEKDLLEQFNPQRLELEIIYNDLLLKFKVRPVSGADDLELIGLDFNVYVNLDELEKQVISKKNSGTKLTQKEEKMYKAAEDKLAGHMMGDALEQAHHILASFLTPPAYSKTKNPKKRYEKKIEFWRGIPFDLKMYLFSEVIDRLGMNPESDVKLFPIS